MKQVYVLRHGIKSFFKGITKESKEECKTLRKKLPKFTIIISSEKPRCIETARELTGDEPSIDTRANIENNTGTELVNLITETLQNIRDGENVLIISHMPCMPPARRILQATDAPTHYAELMGFIVNDNMGVKEFS
jgi:phosphohistidine phosphatase SixA